MSFPEDAKMNSEIHDDMEHFKISGNGWRKKVLTILGIASMGAFIFLPLYFGLQQLKAPPEIKKAEIITRIDNSEGIKSMEASGKTSSVDAGIINEASKVSSSRFNVGSLVVEARKSLDVPFRWEGRGTKRLPGLDCLGLLFKSLEATTGLSWKKWSVAPSRLIEQLEGRQFTIYLKKNRDLAIKRRMNSGDIVFLMWADMPTWDKPTGKVEKIELDGSRRMAPMWIWHTGIYSGNGKFIHASPYSGGVVEEDLLDFSNGLNFDAILVVNIEQVVKKF